MWCCITNTMGIIISNEFRPSSGLQSTSTPYQCCSSLGTVYVAFSVSILGLFSGEIGPPVCLSSFVAVQHGKSKTTIIGSANNPKFDQITPNASYIYTIIWYNKCKWLDMVFHVHIPAPVSFERPDQLRREICWPNHLDLVYIMRIGCSLIVHFCRRTWCFCWLSS